MILSLIEFLFVTAFHPQCLIASKFTCSFRNESFVAILYRCWNN